MKKQNWSREELEASVRSYLEMRQKELDGKKYKKKNITKDYLKNSQELKSLLNIGCRIFLMSFL